jgi:hypothetical protein
MIDITNINSKIINIYICKLNILDNCKSWIIFIEYNQTLIITILIKIKYG